MSITTQTKQQKEVTNRAGQIIHCGDICIARYWYKQSCLLDYESLNCVYKFMASWLAFNFLYAEYNSINPNGSFSGERKVIKEYCKAKRKVINDADIFVKFPDEVAVLTEKPVTSSNEISHSKNKANGNNKDWPRENQTGATNENSDDLTRFQSLIQIIYTVRCNLFHGSKNPTIHRDYSLICASARIIEYLVGELIKTEQY